MRDGRQRTVAWALVALVGLWAVGAGLPGRRRLAPDGRWWRRHRTPAPDRSRLPTVEDDQDSDQGDLNDFVADTARAEHVRPVEDEVEDDLNPRERNPDEIEEATANVEEEQEDGDEEGDAGEDEADALCGVDGEDAEVEVDDTGDAGEDDADPVKRCERLGLERSCHGVRYHAVG